MKILLTHASAELYGSDRMALLAAEALIAKGHDVTAVLPTDGPLAQRIGATQATVMVRDVPVLRRADLHPLRVFALLWRLCGSAGRLLRIIRIEDPNVLYVNTIVQPWWILAGKVLRRPVVVHVREAEQQAHPLVRKVLYGALLLADLVVCNSEATRREITSMIPLPLQRTIVIYNGKDWSNYRTERTNGSVPNGRGREPIALTVIGRLSNRKGQDTAIRALADLKYLGYRAKLTVVGNVFPGNESYWTELITLAKELGVLDRTRFTGFQENVRPVLQATDIAIVPSRIEPFGTVAAECMAAGLLTIAADVQGLTEIVDADRNGLVFPAGDHRALARQIMWVADHPQEAAALAATGQRDVNERFGLDRYQRQIVEAIESVDLSEGEVVSAQRNSVTIAMVTYNSRAHIADCVKWFAGRPDDVRVRIRDNGSTDATPRILSKLAAEGLIDELVLAPDDPGFAIGANDLIRRAGTDDVLLMNPDARITLDTIDMLRDAVCADPTLGAVSPVVSGGDDISVMSAGKQPRLWPMITHYSGLSRLFPSVPLLRGRHLFLQHHSHRDQLVEWTSGCCLYIPRRTIDRAGLLSERWFLYGEDTEYCKRIGDAGLRIKVLSAARAYHEVGGSADIDDVEDDVEEIVTATEYSNGSDPVVKMPPPDVSEMWGRHLYDYYARAYQPNAVARLAWRVTFTSGNAFRAMVRRRRNPQDRGADRLMKNALAVWR